MEIYSKNPNSERLLQIFKFYFKNRQLIQIIKFFGVWGVGFGVWGVGCMMWDVGCELRVEGGGSGKR